MSDHPNGEVPDMFDENDIWDILSGMLHKSGGIQKEQFNTIWNMVKYRFDQMAEHGHVTESDAAAIFKEARDEVAAGNGDFYKWALEQQNREENYFTAPIQGLDMIDRLEQEQARGIGPRVEHQFDELEHKPVHVLVALRACSFLGQ